MKKASLNTFVVIPVLLALTGCFEFTGDIVIDDVTISDNEVGDINVGGEGTDGWEGEGGEDGWEGEEPFEGECGPDIQAEIEALEQALHSDIGALQAAHWGEMEALEIARDQALMQRHEELEQALAQAEQQLVDAVQAVAPGALEERRQLDEPYVGELERIEQDLEVAHDNGDAQWIAELEDERAQLFGAWESEVDAWLSNQDPAVQGAVQAHRQQVDAMHADNEAQLDALFADFEAQEIALWDGFEQAMGETFAFYEEQIQMLLDQCAGDEEPEPEQP